MKLIGLVAKTTDGYRIHPSGIDWFTLSKQEQDLLSWWKCYSIKPDGIEDLALKRLLRALIKETF